MDISIERFNHPPLNNAHTAQMFQNLSTTFLISCVPSGGHLNFSELTLCSGVVSVDFNQHLQSISIFPLLHQKSI